MLKALNEGVRWLTRVCQVAWKLGKAPKDWQTGVIILIYKKGDCKECTNYREISLPSLPGKVYAKCLKKDMPRNNGIKVYLFIYLFSKKWHCSDAAAFINRKTE